MNFGWRNHVQCCLLAFPKSQRAKEPNGWANYGENHQEVHRETELLNSIDGSLWHALTGIFWEGNIEVITYDKQLFFAVGFWKWNLYMHKFVKPSPIWNTCSLSMRALFGENPIQKESYYALCSFPRLDACTADVAMLNREMCQPQCFRNNIIVSGFGSPSLTMVEAS